MVGLDAVGFLAALLLLARGWRATPRDARVLMAGAGDMTSKQRWSRDTAFGFSVISLTVFAGLTAALGWSWPGEGWGLAAWLAFMGLMLPVSAWSWLRRVREDLLSQRLQNHRLRLD